MDDKELVQEIGYAASALQDEGAWNLAESLDEAAARLTALAEENERLRKAVRDAHVALGADGGITEIECSCEFCSEVPR